VVHLNQSRCRRQNVRVIGDLDPLSLLETLTELNQIPVVVKDMEIPDP
jgi:hypothetical protein